MTKKEFLANVRYLEDNQVQVSNEPCWENKKYSRELYFSTDAGGDFSICVEEVTKDKVFEYLDDFDINNETLLWWNSGRAPFSDIKALYEDIEKWVENFKAIAYKMPY